MNSNLPNKYLGPDVPQYYILRTLLKSLGFTDQDLEKPLAALASTWNEILPGFVSYNRYNLF